ncbi:uncharacterized protein LOC111710598 [Eurytemora carolleeae]|uniref:uncharacterized protein LOC111710598 n=1 Tax=Eurytemora carolleeae TaxID=1294199 RepID=UPI000C78E115|nr:uncharacterized protein LOC111710598 [Eurytemora carolleeae]|eukprot:XP_023340478.1 uncharacterized protein LOC111710598 [Eurytemora affinis]
MKTCIILILISCINCLHLRKEAEEDDVKGRMLGLDTGNPDADSEAEMWIMALIGAMAAAIPVAFLSPGLGFRRRRSIDPEEESENLDIVSSIENMNEKINKLY